MASLGLDQVGSLAPELILAAWGLVVLLLDVAYGRTLPDDRRRRVAGGVSLLGVVVAFGWLLSPLILNPAGSLDADLDPIRFFGTIADDSLTAFLNGVILLLLLLVVGMSTSWAMVRDWGAYFALMLWAGAGMMLLIAAEDLIVLFLSLELMTICLYLATAMEKSRRRSPEAGMKYFIYGSVASALFLFGLSLIYGLTGTTSLEGIRVSLVARTLDAGKAGAPGVAGDLTGAVAVLLVLVGLGFKISVVPFHQWAPDAYEGAPAPVAAWIAAGSKVASFVALLKLLVCAMGPWAGQLGTNAGRGWVAVVAIVAAVTMTFGNFAALAQKNFKRMLAYSSIAHAGYVLVGVLGASVASRQAATASSASVLYYLVVYAATTVGAFAVAAWLMRDRENDRIEDLVGLGYRSPGLAACVVVLMLSLIGIPPLAGFFAKWYVFVEALNTVEPTRTIMFGLVGLALLNSVVSAFYYARVLRAMFLRGEPARGEALVRERVPGSIAWPILIGTIVAVSCGLFPSPLLDTLRGGAAAMLNMHTPAEVTLQGENDPTLSPDAGVPTEEDLRIKREFGGRLSGAAPGG